MIYLWVFVSYFLFLPTLLFSAEVNYPTQKDVTDALHTIGKFLKDDGGPDWLAGLVTKQSAPLTTDDLMKEILNATKADDNIKNAANIIILALEEQRQRGPNKTLVLEFEGWKDMIDSIEEENDIICLYRRSYNASSERSDDWQKFLKNISPEYTIYLALDMGQKYVICLKKINVPDREIAARELDKINETGPSSVEIFTTISTNTGGNEQSSGSRSMNHVDRPGNNEKCDLSNGQLEGDDNLSSSSAITNHARRRLPVAKSESPCNRPVILMMPPNYMQPMHNYGSVWPRIGYRNMPTLLKPSAMPYYQPHFIPNSMMPQFPPYKYPVGNYGREMDHSRKHFTIPPKFPQVPGVREENQSPNPLQYARSSALRIPDRSPTQPVRPARYSPLFRQELLYSAPVVPSMTRISFPWPSPRPQADQVLKPVNLMYPPMMPGQGGMMRPLYNIPSSPLPIYPSSLQQNCMSCLSPCDRPILLKVLVENPLNQPVKLSLVPNKETGPGRRQMREGVGNEMENANEKMGETVEGSGDREIS